jgi:hypothetical protein
MRAQRSCGQRCVWRLRQGAWCPRGLGRPATCLCQFVAYRIGARRCSERKSLGRHRYRVGAHGRRRGRVDRQRGCIQARWRRAETVVARAGRLRTSIFQCAKLRGNACVVVTAAVVTTTADCGVSTPTLAKAGWARGAFQARLRRNGRDYWASAWLLSHEIREYPPSSAEMSRSSHVRGRRRRRCQAGGEVRAG